jgi:hypothetical protein
MPDEFDSDDEDTALAPIQPEPEPEYSEGCIRTMIEYESTKEVTTWHQCKCGRSGCRGRQCYLCWTDELTRRTL